MSIVAPQITGNSTVEQFSQAKNKENMKVCITGTLWGKSTSDAAFSSQKVSNAKISMISFVLKGKHFLWTQYFTFYQSGTIPKLVAEI